MAILSLMPKILINTLFLILISGICTAQFTSQDTLRGTITPERAWWDAVRYDITVKPDFKTKTITGKNIITCKALADGNRMQIDMQQPMKITSALCEKKPLNFTRNGNVFYLDFPRTIKKDQTIKIDIDFEGKPREAVNPPWDGGWIWKKDKAGNPWMSVACQLLGASVWYPCKDHQSDEPESASLTILVSDSLIGVGNGRLIDKKPGSYTWEVTNPINNYTIIPYIGKYVNWTEEYNGEKGKLDLSYWVLQQDEEKAKKQFQQVPGMLKCFEHWFGPYPFYEDSYKLVESPHLGMEHQSAVAYGNGFENGYLGKDLSGSGWGKKWDYIIIHESGHEWFANNITTKDAADMWVHEGFTTYSEVVFTECQSGKEAADEYCRGLRNNIDNDIPIIGHYGVNKEGSGDMYFKGANMIHTIRQIFNDDDKFREMLRSMNKDFYHQTVTTQQIEKYISDHAGSDLSKIFDQYLRTTKIPTLEYKYNNDTLSYRWTNCIEGFNMPIKVVGSGSSVWIYPETEWKSTGVKNGANFKPDPNFYVNSKRK
ncbi:MAG: M1 family metallopeptidase [Chitinophagaceae bacterium]|nr:M1 family metallopeptidase [Chitinophagaceae bacterium]